MSGHKLTVYEAPVTGETVGVNRWPEQSVRVDGLGRRVRRERGPCSQGVRRVTSDQTIDFVSYAIQFQVRSQRQVS